MNGRTDRQTDGRAVGLSSLRSRFDSSKGRGGRQADRSEGWKGSLVADRGRNHHYMTDLKGLENKVIGTGLTAAAKK